MAVVYILHSEKADRFYIGSTKDMAIRMEQHLAKVFSGAFTARADDWQIALCLENLGYSQARQIETYIKSMKSKVFIRRLIANEDLQNHIIQKFAEP